MCDMVKTKWNHDTWRDMGTLSTEPRQKIQVSRLSQDRDMKNDVSIETASKEDTCQETQLLHLFTIFAAAFHFQVDCNETDCASSFSRWRRVDGADKTNNTRLATPQLTRVDLYYPNCRSTLLHSTALYCPPYVVEAYRLHFIAVKFDKSDILQQKSVLVQLTI